MERLPFISAPMAWSVNFFAMALMLFGTAETIAIGKNVLGPVMTLGVLTAAFAWLYYPHSVLLRRIALLANAVLLVVQAISMGVFSIATRTAAAEFQAAGFAFMALIIAVCAFNVVAILERPNNSFKPNLLRKSA